jgi:hypothetical protein
VRGAVRVRGQVAHSVERLKVEFLKQMQAEERRVQEEMQAAARSLRVMILLSRLASCLLPAPVALPLPAPRALSLFPSAQFRQYVFPVRRRAREAERMTPVAHFSALNHAFPRPPHPLALRPPSPSAPPPTPQGMQRAHAQEHEAHQQRAEAVLRAAQEHFGRASDALAARAKDLEFRLAARESRPEDRERIAQLEREVAEKEYLCRRIVEEMKCFKAELQTRDAAGGGGGGGGGAGPAAPAPAAALRAGAAGGGRGSRASSKR